MRVEPLPAASAVPDSRGINRFSADPRFADFLKLYLAPALHAHLLPHLEKLGALAGATLDELAATLKAAGAARVVNWVVARTLPPG